LISKVNRTNI